MDKDIVADVRDFLFSRSSNPLIIGFIVSWLFVNYEIPLAIFSSESLECKINFINGLYKNSGEGIYYYLVYPGCYALGSLFTMPMLRFLSLWSPLVENWIKRARLNLVDKTEPMSKLEVSVLKEQINQLVEKSEKDSSTSREEKYTIKRLENKKDDHYKSLVCAIEMLKRVIRYVPQNSIESAELNIDFKHLLETLNDPDNSPDTYDPGRIAHENLLKKYGVIS